jgi:predicted NUDIX family NTP pyrophosphohydrolase
MELGTYRQPNRKRVSAWAVEDDFDPSKLKSNNCQVEWPPKSGRFIEVPEIDRVAWFSLEEALAKVTRGQVPILRALAEALAPANGNVKKEFEPPYR